MGTGRAPALAWGARERQWQWPGFHLPSGKRGSCKDADPPKLHKCPLLGWSSETCSRRGRGGEAAQPSSTSDRPRPLLLLLQCFSGILFLLFSKFLVPLPALGPPNFVSGGRGSVSVVCAAYRLTPDKCSGSFVNSSWSLQQSRVGLGLHPVKCIRSSGISGTACHA